MGVAGGKVAFVTGFVGGHTITLNVVFVANFFDCGANFVRIVFECDF